MRLHLAQNIKRLRKEAGITQEALAETLGVSSQSVSRWELGICYPDLEMLPALANFFGVSVDTLLSNDRASKEEDARIFDETYGKLSDQTAEKIEFAQEYCRKYPENDRYAYLLIKAVLRHAVGDVGRAEKYIPLLSKNAERLLETRYRDAVICDMVCLSDEKELSKWLDLAPYAGFSRRYCLMNRAMMHPERLDWLYQQGMEMLETFAEQLDRRFPDAKGAEAKAEYQRSVLRTLRSFGEDGKIPDGWMMFYAYKQFVLAACLFGIERTEEGWREFDEALAKCRYVCSLTAEWLPIGTSLFADLKVSRDWTFALDPEGNKHKLFGISPHSFYSMQEIADLLTNPRFAWFSPVRESEKFRTAVEWVTDVAKRAENG